MQDTLRLLIVSAALCAGVLMFMVVGPHSLAFNGGNAVSNTKTIVREVVSCDRVGQQPYQSQPQQQPQQQQPPAAATGNQDSVEITPTTPAAPRNTKLPLTHSVDHYGMYPTDKISAHHYDYFYETVSNYKTPIVGEIGVGCGMHYGPYKDLDFLVDLLHPEILYLYDNDRECLKSCPSSHRGTKIICAWVDQTNISSITEALGSTMFDFFIDDGGHWNSMQLNSIEAAMDHINPGGFYLLEDVYICEEQPFNDRGTEHTCKFIDDVMQTKIHTYRGNRQPQMEVTRRLLPKLSMFFAHNDGVMFRMK